MFNSGAQLGAAPRGLGLAVELSELLNQHSQHCQALEQEIAAADAKEEELAEEYIKTNKAKVQARGKAIEARSRRVRAEAAMAHRRAELHARQAVKSKLVEQAEEKRKELASILGVAEEARAAFRAEVAELMEALKKLKTAHPAAFSVEA